MWEASFRNPRSLVISLDGNERILTHEIKIKLKISISYFKSWFFFFVWETNTAKRSEYCFLDLTEKRYRHIDWFEPVRASLVTGPPYWICYGGMTWRLLLTLLHADSQEMGKTFLEININDMNLKTKYKINNVKLFFKLFTLLGAHPLGLTLCGGILKTLNWTKSQKEN